VALLDPPSIESAEVAVAEEAVAQGLAVVRPDTSGESSLRGLGLQAELDSLRAQQVDWEQARRTWDQERAQMLAEREAAEQQRRSWEAERSELQDKVAAGELELELTQRHLAEQQSSIGELKARLTSAEQEAADELKQLTSLQDEMATTSRMLERRELEAEQWSTRVNELQTALDELRQTEGNLRLELEELDLLREDLEETIVERRRELKALRHSEGEARAYAEECKVFREEAEGKIAAAQAEVQVLRQRQESELKSLEERSRQQREELQALAEQARNSVNQDAVKEAERRHLEAEKRLIEANAELETLRKDSADRERLERRCLLLENDLKAANQELMTLERSQSRLEGEKQQISEELEKLKAAGAAGGADEAEIRQWKLRADDLRESLRKQRTENERLQERVDVLIKAKELEEKQRKEVESRLRTALRIQNRQQGSF
jgi:chromosome segregation ATPase